jgi:hypothetical protein
VYNLFPKKYNLFQCVVCLLRGTVQTCDFFFTPTLNVKLLRNDSRFGNPGIDMKLTKFFPVKGSNLCMHVMHKSFLPTDTHIVNSLDVQMLQFTGAWSFLSLCLFSAG